MATRVAQGLLDLDSQTEAYSTSTVGVVQSRIFGAQGLHQQEHLAARKKRLGRPGSRLGVSVVAVFVQGFAAFFDDTFHTFECFTARVSPKLTARSTRFNGVQRRRAAIRRSTEVAERSATGRSVMTTGQ